MGTKPAKVAHRPSWPIKAAKPGLFPVTEDLFAKGLRSAGGPKLLEPARLGRRSTGARSLFRLYSFSVFECCKSSRLKTVE
eukprot:scaffold106945_cov50-Phaeocystis_antarctica.AAC.1